MELMDERLTTYLERQADPFPLPLHEQVDLCHGVAHALSYIHSQNVSHCDICSENVYLIGQRAKVANFSSAQVMGSEGSYCPGTAVYMAPEALTAFPRYTSKLDIFSCGVLFVQLITGKFPDPGPSHTSLATGLIRMASELERREKHLYLISPTHPLLQVVLNCLNESEHQRPTADQLCSRLTAVKESDAYQDSVEGAADESRSETPSAREEELEELEQQLRDSESIVKDLTAEVDKLQLENQHLKESLDRSQADLVSEHEVSHGLRRENERLQERLESALTQLRNSTQKAPKPDKLSHWNVPRDEIRTISEIGRGAYGAVMKGTFRGKTVAVKIPHQNILNQRLLERLKRETRVMIQISHPNLVRIVAAVFDRDAEKLRRPPLIITELMDTNLRQCYLQRMLHSANRVPVFLDVASGLNHLHTSQEPIIHRDVSAPNILLRALSGGMWQAKVSDFGSANLAHNSVTLGEGTIIYSAPETFPREVGAPQPRQTTKIDVYSFGILMCEVVTAEQPDPELYQEKLQEVWRLSRPLYNLIIRCTNRDPDRRLKMGAVITELNKITLL